MVLALLNACTTEIFYAPVKTDNKEFAEDKQNPVINKQDLNKDNPVVTRDIKKHHVCKKLAHPSFYGFKFQYWLSTSGSLGSEITLF